MRRACEKSEGATPRGARDKRHWGRPAKWGDTQRGVRRREKGGGRGGGGGAVVLRLAKVHRRLIWAGSVSHWCGCVRSGAVAKNGGVPRVGIQGRMGGHRAAPKLRAVGVGWQNVRGVDPTFIDGGGNRDREVGGGCVAASDQTQQGGRVLPGGHAAWWDQADRPRIGGGPDRRGKKGQDKRRLIG